NVSNPTSAFAFTIDTVAPTAPTIDKAFDDVGAIQGDLANGGLTDDSTPTLSGRAEANSVVKVYDGDALLGSVTADASGKWSFTPTTPLTEGLHEFHVTATDAAGNVSLPSADFTLTTDYTAPNADNLAITGVDDQVGEIKGNVASGGSTDDSRPTISGTGTAGDTIVVYVTDGSGKHEIGRTTVAEDGTWNLRPATALSGGSNALTAVEIDPVGNATDPCTPYTITVSLTGPATPTIVSVMDDVGTITGALSKGDVTDDSMPTVSGKADAGNVVRIYDGATLLGSTTADASGNWTFTPTAALTDGAHNLTVTAVNAIGQVSESSNAFNFTVDTAAPADVNGLKVIDDVGAVQGELTSGDVTDDATPTFSGKAEANCTVTIYNGSTVIGSATVDASGNWTFTPSAALADGSYTFTTTVTDKAGNQSASANAFNLTIDTSAVEVSITALIDDVGDVTGNIAPNGVTDDTRPDITGSGKAGSTIKIYDGATLLGSTTVASDGSWSFTPASDLGQGAHSITATATDLAGNVSNPTSAFAFTIDTVAPTAPVINSALDDVGAIQGSLSNGSVTDDPTPTLRGAAEENSIVKIYDGSTLLGSAKADANGDWNFTPTTPLTEGEHRFSATSTDAAGNVSGKSGEFVLTTDYTAPNADNLAITGVDDQVGEVTGNIANGGSTDDSRPTISGTGTAGDTIVVYVTDGSGKHEIGRATVAADGTWSLRPATALSGGSNALTAVEIDPVGNATAPSAVYTITVSLAGPVAPVIASVTDDVGTVTGALNKGDVTDDSKPTIVGTAEANSVVRIYDGSTLLGSTTVDAFGNWTFTPAAALADGTHNLTAKAVNSIGQVSDDSNAFDFTVDTAAPADITDLKVIDDVGTKKGELANHDTTDDNKPTFSGKAEANATVTIYDGSDVIGSVKADANGSWSFTPSTALADGSYTFTFTAKDAAGNESTPANAFNLVIDTSAATVSLTKLMDDVGSIKGAIDFGGVTDDARPEIIGTAKSGSVVKVYDGGVLLGSTTADSSGNWSFTPVSDLAQGSHSITAVATDLTGNDSPATSAFTFNVDTVAPAKPTIDKAIDDVGSIQGDLANGAITDDPTPTLRGTAEANSVVKIYEGSALLGSVVTDASGNWSYTPTTPLTEGEHRFSATSTDAAGNVSPSSSEFVLTTDYTAPNADSLAITGVDDQVGEKTGNVASGSATDDTRPTISGTGTAGDTIVVYTTDGAGTREIGRATVAADGTWSLRPATALSSGNNDLTAVEIDPVGNATDPCSPYTIILDTSISDAKITITSISDDRGYSDADFITNDNTLLINGTLDKALLSDEWVEVSMDGGTTWTRAATVSGTDWAVDLRGTVLADGDYTIRARVVDNAYNIGSMDTHALTISSEGRDMNGLSTTSQISTDTSHGLVNGDLYSHSVTTLNGDMVTRDYTVTVSGMLSAALLEGERLQISLDGGATWAAVTMSGNGWSYALPEVTASTVYNFKLQVIDVAGNVGTNTGFAESYKVTIDLDVPDGITVAPVIDSIVSSTETFVFDSSRYGTVEAGTIVSLVSDVNGNGTYQEGLDQVLGFATANADGSWSITTKLPAGAHNLAFVVWDSAGNRSTMSASTSTGVTDGSGSTLIEQSWGGTTDADNRGLNAAAVTISQDGLWSFFQSARGTSGTTTANSGRVYTATDRENYESTYLAQPSTSNGAGYNLDSNTYSRYVNSAVFADINRDGYTDVMSQISAYGNGGRTAYWMQNADGSYSPKVLDQGTLNHLGGVIAYDREGDGYLDFVLADSAPDSISFIKNVNGTLTYEKVSGFDNGHPGGALPANLSLLHEIGAVDIDNNGTVDITAHIDRNSASGGQSGSSRGLGILYNQLTGTGKTNFGEVGYYSNVFRNDGEDDYGNLSISMTYADFNGDGWLDLFLSRGSKSGSNSNESRIYLNDGTGKLLATDAQALWFGDSMDGGSSLAVDWNHDGKMDIIEVPRQLGDANSPTLYLNQGNNQWSGIGQSLTGATKYTNITGAVALDYDWDGSMDLVMYRSGSDSGVVSGDSSAPTLLVKNTNIAADGTSLQIRIVDGNGINTFYSNTVKLYNSAGECVATQLINPQASGSSNSMGLVSFFGLDPNEVYSVQLLRITNGVTNHVGATSSIGGYTNGTVNANWGGLKTSKAHNAYVLTAESDDAVNNTTGESGIIGTGYNDTFFSSAGDDTYTGGGGWNLVVSGDKVWSATEGMDIVDYSRTTSAVNANLTTGVATGDGNDRLISIEGLIGSDRGDTFTDNAANNLFEGRGGDDTFNLTHGGNDTLMYKVQKGQESDGTGGNGHDTVYGFTVGNRLTNSNADLIDLSDLLNYSGPFSLYTDNGEMKLDYSSLGILNYLKVEQVGSDTVISIDRDGLGGTYGFQQLLTLKGVSTDLVTLLANNQIEVGDDTLATAMAASAKQLLQSVTQVFTTGDDVLIGTSGEDYLMGGNGNDTIANISTNDVAMGGDGNDVIKITSTDFASVIGGDGVDTLVFDGQDLVIDLSAMKDKLQSMEKFDLGSGDNTLSVSIDDVLRMGEENLILQDGKRQLVVNGENGHLNLVNSREGGSDSWSFVDLDGNGQADITTINGASYYTYTIGGSTEVLVETRVETVIM
uniref:Ig-like domain-containing protein n=1 Tax=Leminorella grimontii TaxID=82981 RepID=UPI0006886841